MNQNIKNIIAGCLLGDGHLEKTYKETHNSCFSYTSSKKDHVDFVKKSFTHFLNKKYIDKVDHNSIYDKRTNKSYERFFFRTKHLLYFNLLRKKWYCNNLKIIPNDLKLNNTICLYWYIGDGCLVNSKRSQEIRLSTNCFNKIEVEFLCSQLKKFNAHLCKDGLAYKIRIPRKSVNDFLKFIGDCPVESYAYKWKYREYVNHMENIDYKPMINEFINEFKSGKTYYSIAKQRNIEPNVVKYYLKKNGLYVKMS